MNIAKWMGHPVHAVKPRDTIRRARELMAEHRVNQLPVVVDGRIVGIVTDRDLRDAFPSVFDIARSNPPVTGDIGAPPEVAAVLRRACYDCHSHETVWPWYSRVAPISWLVAHDVREGREELNFSAWDRYDPAKRRKKLAKTVEEVDEEEMPPWYYALVHPDARLSAAERELVRAWAAP